MTSEAIEQFRVKPSDESLELALYRVSHRNGMEVEWPNRSLELTFYRVHHGDGLVFECKARNITSAISRFGARCEGSEISEFLLVGGRGQWVSVPLKEIRHLVRVAA